MRPRDRGQSSGGLPECSSRPPGALPPNCCQSSLLSFRRQLPILDRIAVVVGPLMFPPLHADRNGGASMIRLTRLNRVPMVLNSDLIEHIDVTPDTVITLTTGQILRVRESADEVVRRIVEFRRQVFGPDSPLPGSPDEVFATETGPGAAPLVLVERPPGGRPRTRVPRAAAGSRWSRGTEPWQKRNRARPRPLQGRIWPPFWESLWRWPESWAG